MHLSVSCNGTVVLDHVLRNISGPSVDSATSINFPQTLRPLALSSSSLSLVGLGVRTVSFLRVKVYSAGFYLEESVLGSLRGQADWKVSTYY